MAGNEVPWPRPPREEGPWNGGAPVAPPGNTPLPPLPGADGVVHDAHAQTNPWSDAPVVPPAPTGGDRQDPFPGLPAAAAPPTGRAPLVLRVVAAVIVVAVLVGAGYVLLFGGRQYPSEWDSRAASIASWVEDERELEFKHPVEVNFLTDEEYSELSTAGIDADTDEAAEFYADQSAELRALGFVSGDVDLGASNETLSDSGTLAYYDPSVEQVFVRGTELTPALRVTLAHELVHVLQDQHYDLERLGELEDGRSQVLRALAEGDATAIEDAYVADMSDEDREAYQAEASEGADEADEQLESVPPILRTVFAAPYILGPELIALLEIEGGQEAIDEQLVDPPTEEALLNPLLLDSDSLAPKDVELDVPDGAEVIRTDQFGPVALYLMLSTRLDQQEALAAADGWGGDDYVAYRADDRVCAGLAIEGDDQAQTDEIFGALEQWVAQSPDGTATLSTEGSTVVLETCDPGVDAGPVGNGAPVDVLALPVVRTQIYGSFLDGGARPDDARCFANRVVEALTVDQLFSDTYVASPEGEAAVLEIRAECGF